jgi:hypothetical protein
MGNFESSFNFSKETTDLFRTVLIVLTVVVVLGIIAVQKRGVKDKDSDLPILYQPRVLFTIGGIIGTSIIMAVIEVIFARVILLPQTHSVIINNARIAGRALANNNEDEFTKAGLLGLTPVGLTNVEDSISYSLGKTEEIKVKKINNYAFASVIIPVFILLFLFYSITRRIKLSNQKYGRDKINSVHFMALAYGVIFSVLVFGAFQIVFYVFNLGYNYSSDKKIQMDMADAIREGVKCTTSVPLPIPPLDLP